MTPSASCSRIKRITSQTTATGGSFEPKVACKPEVPAVADVQSKMRL
jgi:hypothetical protein